MRVTRTVRFAGLLLVPAIFLAAARSFPLPHHRLISNDVAGTATSRASLEGSTRSRLAVPLQDSRATPGPRSSARPPSTEITLHMTGLLLLAPRNPAKTFPLHVLVPTEGTLPEHVVELGWKSSSSSCGYPNTFRNGSCYFNMDGWAIEIGQNGWPSQSVLPPAGPLDVTRKHKIPRTWFGPTPVSDTIRARLTLHSGKATPGCSLTTWDVDGVQTQLPNVVNWVDSISGTGLTLVATSRTHPASPLVVKTFTTNQVELSLSYEPKVPSTVGGPPYTASHLVRWYDLLKYGALDHRTIPRTSNLLGTCSWIRFLPDHGPGTPTCMPTGGLPEP